MVILYVIIKIRKYFTSTLKESIKEVMSLWWNDIKIMEHLNNDNDDDDDNNNNNNRV